MRCTPPCQECSMKMVCCVCGKQLCYEENGAVRTHGHYTFGDEATCIDCNARSAREKEAVRT